MTDNPTPKRRRPSQVRSRQLTDALVEATRDCIETIGLYEMTTNHIAKRAGTSIGSLYQYFSNKEELVNAVFQEFFGKASEVVVDKVSKLIEEDLETSFRETMAATLDYFEDQAVLMIELSRDWYNPRTADAIRTFERQGADLLRLYFMKHHNEYHIEDLQTVAYVLFNSVVFTIARYIGEKQKTVDRDAFIDQLTRLVTSYVQGFLVLPDAK